MDLPHPIQRLYPNAQNWEEALVQALSESQAHLAEFEQELSPAARQLYWNHEALLMAWMARRAPKRGILAWLHRIGSGS